jgi:biopolymer transport protein TolQ
MIPGEINVLELLSNAGLVVQAVLLLLLFFSVTSWAIIIIKFFSIRKAFQESDLFTEVFWESRDLSVAFKEAKELQGSPIARIFSIGYIELKKVSQSHRENSNETLGSRFSGVENVKRSLRRAINAEVIRLTQMVPFLATTGNITPFVGLFGTVWGIMNSFHGIGQRGSASLAVVAPGISEALVATAAGLAVAIPAVIGFNFFMRKIRIIEAELESFADDFLNIVELDILQYKGEKK